MKSGISRTNFRFRKKKVSRYLVCLFFFIHKSKFDRPIRHSSTKQKKTKTPSWFTIYAIFVYLNAFKLFFCWFFLIKISFFILVYSCPRQIFQMEICIRSAVQFPTYTILNEPYKVLYRHTFKNSLQGQLIETYYRCRGQGKNSKFLSFTIFLSFCFHCKVLNTSCTSRCINVKIKIFDSLFLPEYFLLGTNKFSVKFLSVL